MGVTGGLSKRKHEPGLLTHINSGNIINKMVLVLWVLTSLALLAQEKEAGVQGAPLTQSPGLLGAADESPVALLNTDHEEGAQGLRDIQLFYPQLPTDIVKKEETSTPVPVIHLPYEDEENYEKVAADAILDMIPQELLESNRKVRPVDVKIIEHDGYIDYEIEFVERPDYYQYYDYDEHHQSEEISTTTESSTSPPSEFTFVDLLKKARNNHRQRQKLIESSDETSSSNSNLKASSREENNYNNNNSGRARQRNKTRNPVNKSPILAPPGSSTVVRKSGDIGRSSTTPRPEVVTTADQEPVTNISDDDVVVTTDTTTTQTTTAGAEQLNSFPELPRSSQQEQNHPNIFESDRDENSDKTGDEEVFEDFSEELQTSESKAQLTIFNGETGDRVPKLIRNNDKSQTISTPEDEKTPSDEEVIGGQYHEVNPGQYLEVNPGQYHEVNPGQYHEVNPGQYHEVNPSQYRVEDKDIQFGVDDNRDDYSLTYDVRANAGDFIIGEVGRIDINSGQTLEGVRYTALESEVDYEKIKE